MLNAMRFLNALSGPASYLENLNLAKSNRTKVYPLNRVEQNKISQLEGTYNNPLVQLPDHFGAHQKLKHVIEGIVHILLKHWQVWALTTRKLIPVFHYPLSKEMLPKLLECCEPRSPLGLHPQACWENVSYVFHDVMRTPDLDLLNTKLDLK